MRAPIDRLIVCVAQCCPVVVVVAMVVGLFAGCVSVAALADSR